MSVAGIMLVKDEADIIERSLDHAASQVDWLLVADNLSTDGTAEIVSSHPGVDLALTDAERGHYQSKKMTGFARIARDKGFKWVVPMDADELWSPAEGIGTVAGYLKRQAPNVSIVSAALYDYLPPTGGIDGLHPFDALTWRKEAPGVFPKVAARTHSSLVIAEGNHSATYRTGAPVLMVPGLMIRHFTWRTPEQFVRKIRNGLAAYAATDLDPMYGAHWRMWEGYDDSVIVAGFTGWTIDYSKAADDPELVYDPVS